MERHTWAGAQAIVFAVTALFLLLKPIGIGSFQWVRSEEKPFTPTKT